MPSSMRVIRAVVALVVAISTLSAVPSSLQAASSAAGGDVTVIAVIDSGITPYHWDFLASKMPQANDRDPSNDLPLDRPPHEWLTGFPSPKGFGDYEPLNLTLEERDPRAAYQPLWQKDLPRWNEVQKSTPDDVNFYWIPGTKVIGAVDFGTDKIYGDTFSHGTGASSVAVGNLHGSCPECLLVFIDTGGFSLPETEQALEWAESQPWIDAVSNSYGHSTVFTDNVYDGSDTEAQRKATERGQTVFFAAHNGHDRFFVVPNNTLLSSQPGPDWIVTVGAVHPETGASFTGQGKPADISGVGLGYPSAYGSPDVGGEGEFSGTSNATPVVTGLYGRALYAIRLALSGSSRVQAKGVIARGIALVCGKARRGCELGDGALTAAELRRRLFHGAVHTASGMTAGAAGPGVGPPPIGEDEFLNEGHGTYFGLLNGPKALAVELGRIIDPIFGRAKILRRPEGEREWMLVDSFCRQHLWGSWKGGYYIEGRTTLPDATPLSPLRTAILTGCPHIGPF